jgi:hypothetical protein
MQKNTSIKSIAPGIDKCSLRTNTSAKITSINPRAMTLLTLKNQKLTLHTMRTGF